MKRALVSVVCLTGCGGGVIEGGPPTSTAAVIDSRACVDDEASTAAAFLLKGTRTKNGETLDLTVLRCSGTLIAPDVVMFAAHCFDFEGFYDPATLEMYVSFKDDLTAFVDDNPAQPLPPPDDAIAVHASGLGNRWSFITGPVEIVEEGDIDVVFLERATDHVRPALLITPREALQIDVGDDVTIAGWGRQTPDDDAALAEKLCATSTITALGPALVQVGAAGMPQICSGDSGGPTFIDVDTPALDKRRLIGVHSRGTEFGDHCVDGSVDTRFDHYRGFIDEVMRYGCETGARAWCEVPGIIAPSFYEPGLPEEEPVVEEEEPVVEEEEPIGEGGEGEGEGDGGEGDEDDDVGCAAGNVGNVMGLGVLLLWRRRRR